MVRVISVDPDAGYRAFLDRLLRYSGDFILVGGYARPEAVVSALRAARERGQNPEWDLMLVDRAPPGRPCESVQRLKVASQDARVVVLSADGDPASIFSAVSCGADGYLLKDTAADCLLDELRTVRVGGCPLSAKVTPTILELIRRSGAPPSTAIARGVTEAARSPDDSSSAGAALTERELQVLRCIASGLSYKATARELGISVETVRTHIKGLYAKLRVHSVVQALWVAINDRLL